MLNEHELKEIEARCAAATPSNLRLMDDGIIIEDDGSVIADFGSKHDDARLFIHARTDIPSLIDHIHELEEEKARLPRALVWTTEPPNVEGFYWARRKNTNTLHVVRVMEIREELSVFMPGSEIDGYLHWYTLWAGPIPEPQEPTL